MPLTTFTHSLCPTARLFILKSLFSNGEKHIIITDSERDHRLLQNFANFILGKNVIFVTNISEFWSMLEEKEGIFCINTKVLEFKGNIEHLKRQSLFTIERGAEISPESIIEKLIAFGYNYSEYRGELGTYKKEGSLLSIVDGISGNLYQIEWFDTEIDSIIEVHARAGERSFRNAINIKNQKPLELKETGTLNEGLLEVLKNEVGSGKWEVGSEKDEIRSLKYAEEKGEMRTPKALLERGEDFPVSVENQGGSALMNIEAICSENSEQNPPIPLSQGGILTTSNSPLTTDIIVIGCDFLPYIGELRNIATIHFSEFQRENSISLDVSVPDIPHIDVLKEYLLSHKKVSIYTKYEKTVRDFLEYNSITGVTVIPVSRVGLESFTISTKYSVHGTIYQEPCTIIADDILSEIFVRKRTKKSIAKNLDLLLSLNPGDYVVHREHGIAKFHAVVKKTVGKDTTEGQRDLVSNSSPKLGEAGRGVQGNGTHPFNPPNLGGNTGTITREYLELHYADDDKLFVPLTEIYRVSKYLGNLEPELTRLSGKEWEKTMEKADEEIEIIAQDILETSAKRTLAKGRAFGKFPLEEEKFRDAFSYEYTQDQLNAILEIFEDMEAPTPMDRLVSGDVGFGKTEVAMNAIYKAVLSGTQVAVISPLLVLADEHYETFSDRLGTFGVKVGVMTRMNSEREIRDTLTQLKNGTIDVVVGTHRLLSDDVRFAKLGLLIIDEEHKFGVTHKEKLKKLRAGLDILSLSATPIPRSLNLALSGLKKISILATPPKKKKPIETIITRWNETIIGTAISQELARGGQVIIVHNRIRGMESIEKEIENIVASFRSPTEKVRITQNDSNAPLIRGVQGGSASKINHIPYKSTLTEKAKENRKSGNPIENHFWYDILKSEQLKEYKFTRQKPLLEYIVDFYCSELGIVIEIDGDSHIGNEVYDKKRSEDLYRYGLKIIRYSNKEIMENSEGILEDLLNIIHEIETNPPTPLLRGAKADEILHTAHYVPSTTYQAPRIIITHGQMPGEQIEDRIHAFKRGEYDILLTTTIIENGVNFLSANTIIIIDPEEFGLAQLHQLRGRVGRKDEQGYCYLMYRKPELVKDEKERLITIANNTHLGAGFEISMRDLEIRGAGDVLGIKQSGKSKDVGLTLYFRMLEEKIEELKNERKKRVWTKVELDISFVIPDEYFLSETDKLNFFREIENIETIEELEEVEEVMQVGSVRYEIGSGKVNLGNSPLLKGDVTKGQGEVSEKSTTQNPPNPLSQGGILATNNLFLLLRARLLLSEYGVIKVSKVGINYVFDFADSTDVPKVRSFLERFDKKHQMVLLSVRKIRVETRFWKSAEEFLRDIVN